MQKIFLVALFVLSVSLSHSQEESDRADVPFTIIENVPVYPDCEQDSNEALKKCMSEKISEFFGANFDHNLANTLNLKAGRHRIAVQFKIDKKGKVVDVKAKAPHPALEEEAIRVTSSLPKMKPGIHRGEKVNVLYALPIIFMVEPKNKTKRAKTDKGN